MSADARLSIVNHWATGTITGTTALTSYPLTNVKDAARPFLTYRSTNTTNVEIIADLGSAKLDELVLLLNCNFTSAHLQAHASNSWGAPTHASGALTISRQEWNGRYTLAYLTSGWTAKQWNRVFIPTQATTDGAAYFEVGGVWAGPLLTIPGDWQWDADFDPNEDTARLEVRAELGGWGNRYDTGDIFTTITATRKAALGSLTAFGQTDTLASFRSVDRQWYAANYGGFYLNRGDTAQAWVMRPRNARPWRISAGIAESQIELEEVVAG